LDPLLRGQGGVGFDRRDLPDEGEYRIITAYGDSYLRPHFR
jgi:hypothetical protein